MSYFGFLTIFLVIPLIIISVLNWLAARRPMTVSPELDRWSPTIILVAHVLIAVLYTTPWDNYLVASRVWWYDPQLVTGIVLGWVPIEEYTFFILQPLFTGSWLLFLARWMPVTNLSGSETDVSYLRKTSTLVLLGVWLGMTAVLLLGWQPGTYLALELVWVLPPLMLQLAFGADILWHHRRLVFLSLVPTTLYLSAVDALAIASGIWTINPDQSLGINIGGLLPLEELLFFALTNTLLTFGMVLVLACGSRQRLKRHEQKLAC